MIAQQLTTRHEGQTLRLPEDGKNKHRRHLIQSVAPKPGYMLVTARGSHGGITSLALPFGTAIEVTP